MPYALEDMKRFCAKRPLENLGHLLDSLLKGRPQSSALTLCFLFLVLILLIAYPGTNSSFVEVSSQRNFLDHALKNLINPGHSIKQKEQLSPEMQRRLASLNYEDKDNLQLKETYPGLTASFPHVFPVMGPRKSSGFGIRVHPVRGFSSNHKGVDLAAPVGASIRSMASGQVIFADPYAGYGKLVVINHGQGVTTHYAHCDQLTVHTGQLVETGQIIAEVGSTGVSTGPHLHLEVRINGEALNPEIFFPGLGDKAEG